MFGPSWRVGPFAVADEMHVGKQYDKGILDANVMDVKDGFGLQRTAGGER